MDNIIVDHLNDYLIEFVPELKSAYEDELNDWVDEIPGAHIVYADLLVPYLTKLFAQESKENRIREIFGFLEKLSVYGSSDVGDVVALSVLDPLRNQVSPQRWSFLLGQVTFKMLENLESS